MTTLEQAREALRLRQGAGARDDAPEAPARDLMLARSGTAYFARKLNELSNEELYEPSAIEGWTRAHVICDIAYQARGISRQLEAVTAGQPAPVMHDSAEALAAEIDLGATLPPRAIRHLFDHAAIHLNVVWRDLPGPGWAVLAPGEDGRQRALSATPLERARHLWQRSLDLGNGARIRDLPEQFRPLAAHLE
ncbi:MAG: maleylpyruvate isomerase N-terminal domain-containing protein [Devosia sp.]|nr:maleylpyruvate isomerase N-terminal domain-containing protein [Devosia sp.]